MARLSRFFLGVLVLGLCNLTQGAVKTGESAPAFSLEDHTGKKRTLADSKGKWVVLEWLNHGCPFVRKHYDAGNMQALQKKYGEKGVVWYSVISSAPGTQGFSTKEQATADLKKYKASPAAVLFDPDGAVGKAYGAMTTPHMYIINPDGKLVYQGAIDDKATTEVSDVATAKSYLVAALDAAMAGQKVEKPTTKAYGCSVKYKK